MSSLSKASEGNRTARTLFAPHWRRTSPEPALRVTPPPPRSLPFTPGHHTLGKGVPQDLRPVLRPPQENRISTQSSTQTACLRMCA